MTDSEITKNNYYKKAGSSMRNVSSRMNIFGCKAKDVNRNNTINGRFHSAASRDMQLSN